MNRRNFLIGSVLGGSAAALLARRALAQEAAVSDPYTSEPLPNTVAAIELLQSQVDAGTLAGAVLHVRHRGRETGRAVGNATPKSVFYLASLTKPMTATAVMILVDRGQVALDDPVQKFIPEFTGDERDKVLVRHLLSHSSGLPDMLPENEALRTRHAPLSEFVALACTTPLLYSPGTQARYQSSGILLAGEIVARVSGGTLADFMKTEIFTPLAMNDSSLGLGGRRLEDTVQLQRDADTDWAQNSPYWRNLLAPWADVHSTAADVSRFTAYFLHPDDRVLRPATAAAMITNQNEGLNRAWGFGWSFGGGGENSSAATVGHGGSSGTSMWLDPQNDLSCVLLTSLPSQFSGGTILRPVSNLVSNLSG